MTNIPMPTLIGDKIADRIQKLQDLVEQHAQVGNELRAVMFRVASMLRVKDPEALKDEIRMLELPATGCDGSGCITAINLNAKIHELEQQLFQYESVMFNLTSQLSINPFDEEEYPDAGCCPRNEPTIQQLAPIETDVNPL
jgi:hypothetical protein